MVRLSSEVPTMVCGCCRHVVRPRRVVHPASGPGQADVEAIVCPRCGSPPVEFENPAADAVALYEAI